MTWSLLHRFRFAVVVLSIMAFSGGIAHARDFTIVGWGGFHQQTRSDLFIKPRLAETADYITGRFG